MKKILVIIAFISFQIVYASVFDKHEFMSVKDAKEKWGYEELNKTKFKNSGYEGDKIKAKMAADIIEKQAYNAEEIALVYKELGPANGYFISDLSPAYVLQRPTDDRQEGWQLVFIPTENGKKVKEVRIVKTCCK